MDGAGEVVKKFMENYNKKQGKKSDPKKKSISIEPNAKVNNFIQLSMPLKKLMISIELALGF